MQRTRAVLNRELDSGDANDIMVAARRQQDEVEREYLNPQLDNVQAYLARDAEHIRDNVFQRLPARGYDAKAAELMGSVNRATRVRIDPMTEVDAFWVGPYCSTANADGRVIGPFGEPEVVKLVMPGAADRTVIAHIPGPGWNVRYGRPFTGVNAVMTVFPQWEDHPMLEHLPVSLRQLYQGEMTYNNGDFYDGAWRQGVRHGFGKHTFANQGSYKGGWADDKFHGRGLLNLNDASQVVFDGTFANGQKHGPGQLTIPAAPGREATTVNGQWRHDVFVLPSALPIAEARTTVLKLPPAWRESWRGEHIV